jgi:hypothetical protein
LREALAYGQRLARVWLTEVRLSCAPIIPPAGFTVTRVGYDAAVEEQKRREDVVLE